VLERRAVGRRRQPLHAGDGPSTLTKGEGCDAADAQAVVLRAGGTLCEPARTLANEVQACTFATWEEALFDMCGRSRED